MGGVCDERGLGDFEAADRVHAGVQPVFDLLVADDLLASHALYFCLLVKGPLAGEF